MKKIILLIALGVVADLAINRGHVLGQLTTGLRDLAHTMVATVAGFLLGLQA